jgi:hypothetical protein
LSINIKNYKMKKSPIIHLAALALVLSSFNERANAQTTKAVKPSTTVNQKAKKQDTTKRKSNGARGGHFVPYVMSGTNTTTNSTSSAVRKTSTPTARPKSVPSTPRSSSPVSRGGFGHSVSSAS